MSTPEPHAEDKKSSDPKSLLIVGAMISAIGLGVMLMAVAALNENWFTQADASFTPFWLMAPLAIASVALFAAVNPTIQPGLLERVRRREKFELAEERALFPIRPVPARSADRLALLTANQRSIDARARRKAQRDDVLRIRALLLSLLAAGALVFSLLLLHDLAREVEARGPGPAARYALALPAEAGPPRTEDSAARPYLAPTVLFWQVEGKKPKARLGGALPIALGGLFLVALGAGFPHVGLNRFDDAASTIAKLAAPILSLALVALGATQQAESTRLAADERLAREGLPATVRISRERIEHHVTRPDRMAVEGLLRLEKQMSVLETQIEEDKGRVSGLETLAHSDRRDFLDRLERLRGAIKDPVASTITVQDFAEIKNALVLIDARAREQEVARCRLLEREAEALKARSDELAASAERKRTGRTLKARFTDWRNGMPGRDTGEEDSRRAADLLQKSSEAQRQFASLCPPPALTLTAASIPDPRGPAR